MIRVAVTGAKGRMGSTVVSAVTDAPDMEVVALFDAGDEITAQSVNGAQVAVDFSIPSSTRAWMSSWARPGGRRSPTRACASMRRPLGAPS